jgi:hypothetical protein
MTDNIKIVGEILNTQEVSRYNDEDIQLLVSQQVNSSFGQPNDYIEYFVYDAGNNFLNGFYDYKDFKSPTTSYVDPVNGSLPIIEIDPIKDLQNLGYNTGEFVVYYNFFTNKISNSNADLFLKEISADRTELRVGSTVLTNSEIETATLALINEISGSAYFVDYLINFGNNEQVLAVNVALNRLESGYEILFKLYQPLPDTITEKSSLWVVDEKIDSYNFNINLDKLIIPAPLPILRGPNFDIKIPDQNNIATSYQTYNSLINNFQSVSTSSYQQLLSLIQSQSIDINTDYSNFSNFSFFGSAKTRLDNFYNKVKQIEEYKNDIVAYTALTSSRPNLITELNSFTSSVNNIISNFDGFEYYMYFESSSILTSSVEYGITPYPKSSSTKPYPLLATSSVTTIAWYNFSTSSADNYDNNNSNQLIETIPSFIREDDNNEPYLTFVEMVGHYFDNIWIFLQAVTDINLANNNLEQGISKDLVYFQLQSLGTKLYNQYGNIDNIKFLIGESGSAVWDNNFTYTGSYLNAIPRKDLLAESYKRIYHNLPLLLKTKGTAYGLQTLVSTFGITGSTLQVKEYGGDTKAGLLDEFNNDKVRVVSNTITGSVLSPFISLQTYPTSSAQFRTNDLHYIDISFSPQEKIDIFASASIAVSASTTWSLDDFIGDPRAQYSGSYPTLEIERQKYYSPLSASIVPYTGSAGNGSIGATDYNSFIRLIQFFDNSLFKMLKDYVPARANLSTGVSITSPTLERNKWSYANPSSTSEIEVNEGTIDGVGISTEYTTLYTKLSGDKSAYYDGDITGSTIDVYSYYEDSNPNPYVLGTTASWNAQHTVSESANYNKFLHSDFNVLLNNVTNSLVSNTRQEIEYVFGTTRTITSSAELQDSYESLRTHQLSRYEGVKLSSLTYNNYTSASTTYDGDISYGKTATIDRRSRKLGLFTDIISSSYLPGRNNVRLLYLVDEFGELTELNQRNKHWEEIQNTFVQGETLDVSQFDVQKFSPQKTTDGTKDIFDSGYTYSPILYFSTCSVDPKIYFQFQGSSNSYLAVAKTEATASLTISGYSTNNYPVSSSVVKNIFDNVIQGGSYLSKGTTLAAPTYSIQEGGAHKVSASLSIDVYMPQGGTQTWQLGIYKGASLIDSSTSIINSVNEATASLFPFTSSQAYPIYNAYSPYQSTIQLNSSQTIISNKPVNLAGVNYPIGTTFYKYNASLFNSFTPGGGFFGACGVNGKLGDEFYSLSNVPSYTGVQDFGCTDVYEFYLDGFWSIPDLDTAAGTQTATFSIDNSSINANQGDKISVRFSQITSSTADYTASFNNSGLLTVSSLSVSTGYASTTCLPDGYFESSSLAISASITGSNDEIIFSQGVSSFYGSNYLFVPNPLTGSQNSLFDEYGFVDYIFQINPYDIIVVGLSDGTYVESRILSVNPPDSVDPLLRIKLDSPLPALLRTDLANSGGGLYRYFLILSRRQDETSAHLTFKKREGKTSYGFIIPNDISPDVLAKIDIITKEVKQKLINEQSAIDNISGGTFG